MKTKNIISQLAALTIILISFSSCVKDNIDNSLIQNFELLWTEFNENYAGFQARGVDWDEMYVKYQAQAVAATTEAELWDICGQMLNELDDGHIRLIDRNGENWDDPNTPDIQLKDIYDLEVIENQYLAEGFNIAGGNEVRHHVFGKTKEENLGYLRIFTMDFLKEETWASRMDQFIAQIKDTDGLIIDMRVNGGGEPQIAIELANRFATKEATPFFIKTKNGPGPNDFDEPTGISIMPGGSTQYTKPIVVLTDEYSGSAAEDFILLVSSQDHVTHLGTNSDGIFSNISLQKYLPNGWSFAYTHQLAVFADGTSPEGVGVVPEIEVLNTKEDWNAGRDKVLEAAIEQLK